MFLEDGNIEVVTGVNLPMVIKLASHDSSGSLILTARRVSELGAGNYLAGICSPSRKKLASEQAMIERKLLVKARLGLHARGRKTGPPDNCLSQQDNLRRVDGAHG